jgi:hypothetical protein
MFSHCFDFPLLNKSPLRLNVTDTGACSIIGRETFVAILNTHTHHGAPGESPSA